MSVILEWLSVACQELPSNIYFISKALTQIFFGEHIKPMGHVCNHRYFISQDEERSFIEQFSTFEETETLCSCSALDMLFQTSILLDQATGLMLYDLLFTLFQTYEFKQALAMTYIANLDTLTKRQFDDDKSLLSIGV
jgi:hypothetical protein